MSNFVSKAQAANLKFYIGKMDFAVLEDVQQCYEFCLSKITELNHSTSHEECDRLNELFFETVTKRLSPLIKVFSDFQQPFSWQISEFSPRLTFPDVDEAIFTFYQQLITCKNSLNIICSMETNPEMDPSHRLDFQDTTELVGALDEKNRLLFNKVSFIFQKRYKFLDLSNSLPGYDDEIYLAPPRVTDEF